MESLEQTITDIIQNQLLGMPVRPKATFSDHGFDSLDFVCVIMTVEDELGITIDDNKLKEDMTIESFIEYVKGIVEKEAETAETEEVN